LRELGNLSAPLGRYTKESTIVNQERRSSGIDLAVFMLLIGIGVAGRWGQPAWCFTPTAAAAIFAGFYFSRIAVAALVPLAILGLSDLALPAYDNIPVMLATYAVLTVPVWFGRMLRGQRFGWSAAGRWALCGLAPATAFWLVSNFAVWAFQSDYEKSLAGLVQCYVAAVPFYRWMLAGDVCFLVALFGCWALAGMMSSHPEPLPLRASSDNTPRD
jgi:hypothetical protein